MENDDLQELIYRIQGRSENYDSSYDPVSYKGWTSGTHSAIITDFNDYIDSLTAENSTIASENKICRFLLHANVDGAHIMIFNTVLNYSLGEWLQIAFGAAVQNQKLIVGNRIMVRRHLGNEWTQWTDYANNADEEDVTFLDNGTLSLKNKRYDMASNSGQGRIYVRKNANLSEILSTYTNTRFIIQYNHLLTEDTYIGEGNSIKFEGGTIGGAYELVGNETVIEAAPTTIFDDDIVISGTWKSSDYYCEWFNKNIQKTIDCFKSVKLIGDYYVRRCIIISDFAKIEFATNSRIVVADTFISNYLFDVHIVKEDVRYRPQQNDAVRFHGNGLVDLNRMCGFARVRRGWISQSDEYFKFNVYFQDIRAIRGGKNPLAPSTEPEAIVSNYMQEVFFDNCWFSDSNDFGSTNPPELSPRLHDYGIYCADTAYDCKFNRVTIVARKGGIRLTDAAFLSDVHVWGWTNIAFDIYGNGCVLTSVYADSATEAFHCHENVASVQIVQFGTARCKLTESIQDKVNSYLLVTDSPNGMKGILHGRVDNREREGYQTIHYPCFRYDAISGTYQPVVSPKLLFINTYEGFVPNSMATTQRPLTDVPIGYSYFDTTMNKPIWWNGSNWIDAAGTVQGMA